MARKRPGIQGRLDAVQSHVHGTLNTAEGVMLRLEAKLDGLVDEMLDGITFKLVKVGDSSIMDFFSGKIKELPLAIEVVLKEQDEKQEDQKA